MDGNGAYLFLAAVVLIDSCLLYRFFSAGPRFRVAPAVTAELKTEKPSVFSH